VVVGGILRRLSEFDRRIVEMMPKEPPAPSEFIGMVLSGWVLFPACGLVALLYDRGLGLRMLAALAASMAVSEGLKILVGRPRPERAGRKPWGYSFPSTHTARVASLVPIVHHEGFFKATVFLSALTVAVAVARVVSRAHYPTDVIGGFIVGTLTGYAVVWLW